MLRSVGFVFDEGHEVQEGKSRARARARERAQRSGRCLVRNCNAPLKKSLAVGASLVFCGLFSLPLILVIGVYGVLAAWRVFFSL